MRTVVLGVTATSAPASCAASPPVPKIPDSRSSLPAVTRNAAMPRVDSTPPSFRRAWISGIPIFPALAWVLRYP